MSLDYEKKKYKVLKEMVDNYWQELQQDRLRALDMPIETDNGFNVEREALIDDIDEKLEILRRHAKEPYFAKLVFNDVNDGKEFKGYIGRLSIGDIANPEDEKVVDWRSPISDLYYNGRLGRSDYTAHGNKFEVDLHLKRQINIKNDEVESIYDFEEAVSSDEFLQPFLTQSADNRLKNIVATIQEEQNRIIRLPVFKNCIIQGVAGSGKTTVALHRLSYLIYNFKKSIYPEEFLILSPNEIFTSYISTTLVDLDADKANSFSINKMVENVIGTEYKVLNKHEQFRKLEQKNISYKYLKYKTSLKFKDVIEKFIEDYTKSIFGSDLVIKGVKVLDAQDVYKYYKLDRKEPLEVIAEHGGKKLSLALHYDEIIKKKAYQNIDNADVDMFKKWEIKRLVESNKYKYFKTITTKSINIFKLYKAFIESLDKYSDYEELNILKKYTLDNLKNKTLSYDDLGAILYLYARLFDLPYYSKLKCVFIDEAQDLSELMYSALRVAFKNAYFSIFGDVAQGIYSYQAIDNWEQILNIINECEILYLKRSYRTSIEIMEDANITLNRLGFKPANNVIRHGEQVDYVGNCDTESVATKLKELNDKYDHTAIICKDENELNKALEKLSGLELVVLDENNLSYNEHRNTILTVQTAKGLEFDSVIIYNAKSFEDNDIDLKLLYVAKTRALHKLVIMG